MATRFFQLLLLICTAKIVPAEPSTTAEPKNSTATTTEEVDVPFGPHRIVIVEEKEFNGVFDNPDLVGFYLYYDPSNPNVHDVLDYGNFTSILASHYDPRRATKFLIHGFTQNEASSFPTNVKNSYLQHTGLLFNVIAVDWGKLSSPKHVFPLFYQLAHANVPKVGRRVAEFILFLKNHSFIIESQVHIIGFSLGAHVSSNAGAFVQFHARTRLARITGLDPAGPGYNVLVPSVKKLERWDADFVDVIHTNAGQLGYPLSMGHADFFVNGGTYQPSCATVSANIVSELIGNLSGACSHGKAPIYFAMSIDPTQYGRLFSCQCYNLITYHLGCGQFCRTKTVLGEYTSTMARGNHYLTIIPFPESSFGANASKY